MNEKIEKLAEAYIEASQDRANRKHFTWEERDLILNARVRPDSVVAEAQRCIAADWAQVQSAVSACERWNRGKELTLREVRAWAYTDITHNPVISDEILDWMIDSWNEMTLQCDFWDDGQKPGYRGIVVDGEIFVDAYTDVCERKFLKSFRTWSGSICKPVR